MRIQFNTGRTYTQRGQVIVAATCEEPCGIKFSDKDRHIEGFIPQAKMLMAPHELREIVMFNYDRCNYHGADYRWDPEMEEKS